MATAGKNVRKKLPKEKPFLPDEIVTNILFRLPVKSLFRYALVCRRWGEIISDRDFVDLHLKTSIPLILATISKNYSAFDFFAFDQWWEFDRTRLMIHRFPNYLGHFPESTCMKFSNAGLIVLRRFFVEEPEFYILNPARPSSECVKITICKQIWESDICAVYYHPSLNEYCCLLKINESLPFSHKRKGSKPIQPKPIQYKLLNLGSDPSLKTISNLFSYKLKDKHSNPLFINTYLYWMLESDQDYNKYGGRNDILEFDILSEEFNVIPCPVPLNSDCSNHQTHLLNNCDGVLSFVLVLPNTITIWRLEDRVEHLWTSTGYTISIEICHSYEAVGIIALVDGILAFQHHGKLFLCNLKEGTVKNYPKRKYNGNVKFFSHQMSLASLKNCKSALYINKDLEVLEGPIPDEKNGCPSGLGNSSLQHSRRSSSRPQFSTPDVRILELTQQISDLTNQNHLLNEKIQEMAARYAARDTEMATFRSFMTNSSEDRETSGSAS